MFYMLSKNRHRLGHLNFNQIEQIWLKDRCTIKIETPLTINDTVLENNELLHNNCEENYDDVNDIHECRKENIVVELIEEIETNNIIETPPTIIDTVNDIEECTVMNDTVDINNVSSQIIKMEEVIKRQKVIRRLNRKNSW